MFQNISEQINEEKNNEIDFNKIKLICKEVFKYQNIIIYILAFLVSGVSLKGQAIPFGLAILAACLGTGVPIIAVFIVSLISTTIFQGWSGLEFYFLSALFYFAFVIFFKPKVSIEERNEVLKTGVRLFWACFIVSQINNLFNIFLIYDLFMGIIISALVYVFYKIFVNGIVVLRDFNIKKAFSIEEIVGATLIIAIASITFNSITIFELSITNIILIFILLVIGWKNGILVGGLAGISTGLILSVLGVLNPIQIAAIAVSGAFAGLLNKFGKIGVIIGFILGNSILTYITNGNTATIIYFREIFIASIILLFVPNKFKLEIEDLIGRNKLLTNIGETRLNSGNTIVEKINAISNSISDLTNKIQEDEDIDISNIDNFVEDFLDNLEEYRDNLFYDDLNNNDCLIKDMYYQVEVKDILVEKDVVEIFKKYNNFILTTDEKIRNDLQDVIKVINRTYKMQQIRNIKLEEKKKANKKIEKELTSMGNIIKQAAIGNKDKKVSKQELEILTLLKNKSFLISDVHIKNISNGKIIIELIFENTEKRAKEKDKIANIADLMSRIIGKKLSFDRENIKLEENEYVQIYSTEDIFTIKVGSTKISKEDSEASGDCNLQIKLEDGKYLLAISDGRGSGRNARNTSKTLLKVLKNLLLVGFDKEESIKLINSSLYLNKDEEMYATADISILDLYEGTLTSIKNAACTTYIKNKNNIKKINSKELPVGILEDIELNPQITKLNDGDIILMCSDGLLESKEDISKDWIENFLKNVNTNNVQKLSDLIVAEAIDNSYGVVKDDITVIVAKIVKKK